MKWLCMLVLALSSLCAQGREAVPMADDAAVEQRLVVIADVLAAQAGGNLEGQPLKLVNAALQLEPDNPMALSLAATAAFKRKDSRTIRRPRATGSAC